MDSQAASAERTDSDAQDTPNTVAGTANGERKRQTPLPTTSTTGARPWSEHDKTTLEAIVKYRARPLSDAEFEAMLASQHFVTTSTQISTDMSLLSEASSVSVFADFLRILPVYHWVFAVEELARNKVLCELRKDPQLSPDLVVHYARLIVGDMMAQKLTISGCVNFIFSEMSAYAARRTHHHKAQLEVLFRASSLYTEMRAQCIAMNHEIATQNAKYGYLHSSYMREVEDNTRMNKFASSYDATAQALLVAQAELIALQTELEVALSVKDTDTSNQTQTGLPNPSSPCTGPDESALQIALAELEDLKGTLTAANAEIETANIKTFGGLATDDAQVAQAQTEDMLGAALAELENLQVTLTAAAAEVELSNTKAREAGFMQAQTRADPAGLALQAKTETELRVAQGAMSAVNIALRLDTGEGCSEAVSRIQTLHVSLANAKTALNEAAQDKIQCKVMSDKAKESASDKGKHWALVLQQMQHKVDAASAHQEHMEQQSTLRVESIRKELETAERLLQSQKEFNAKLLAKCQQNRQHTKTLESSAAESELLYNNACTDAKRSIGMLQKKIDDIDTVSTSSKSTLHAHKKEPLPYRGGPVHNPKGLFSPPPLAGGACGEACNDHAPSNSIGSPQWMEGSALGPVRSTVHQTHQKLPGAPMLSGPASYGPMSTWKTLTPPETLLSTIFPDLVVDFPDIHEYRIQGLSKTSVGELCSLLRQAVAGFCVYRHNSLYQAGKGIQELFEDHGGAGAVAKTGTMSKGAWFACVLVGSSPLMLSNLAELQEDFGDTGKASIEKSWKQCWKLISTYRQILPCNNHEMRAIATVFEDEFHKGPTAATTVMRGLVCWLLSDIPMPAQTCERPGCAEKATVTCKYCNVTVYCSDGCCGKDRPLHGSQCHLAVIRNIMRRGISQQVHIAHVLQMIFAEFCLRKHYGTAVNCTCAQCVAQ